LIFGPHLSGDDDEPSALQYYQYGNETEKIEWENQPMKFAVSYYRKLLNKPKNSNLLQIQ